MPYGIDSWPEGGVAPPAPRHADGGRVGLVLTNAEKAEAHADEKPTGALPSPAVIDFSRHGEPAPKPPVLDYVPDLPAEIGRLEARLDQLKALVSQQMEQDRINKEKADGGTVREHSPVLGEGEQQREGKAVFPDRAGAPEDEAGPRSNDGEGLFPGRAGSPGGDRPAGPDDERRDRPDRAGEAPEQRESDAPWITRP